MSRNAPRFCVFCKSPGELLCPICSDVYCSERCQKIDWPNHRPLCKRMPSLIHSQSFLDMSASFESLVIPNDSPKPAAAEDITNKSQTKEIKPTAMPELTKPKEVVQKPETLLETVEKSFNQKPAPPKRLEMPEKPKEEEPKRVEKPKVVEPPKPQEEKPKEVAPAKPPTLKIPQFLRPATEKKPMMLSDLKRRPWPETKKIKVRIIAAIAENVFAFAEDNKEVLKYLEMIGEEIQKYCKGVEKKPYKPVVGEVVFSMFMEEWYRAQVLKVDGTKIDLQYIEYGNFDSVTEVVPVPPDMKFDICARFFVVENFPADPSELNEKQLEIVQSESITITDLRVEENCWFCNIFGF